jgi:hypothetical protein
MEKKVARIFEDIGGYFVCDEELYYLDARGCLYHSKTAAMLAAASAGYTHAIGSGTYWGNAVRRIPANFRR